MSIQILENAVIDQIAAGEVVERPAHMIKELVENSIDSGASEISIDFKNSGRDVLIRDNGHGIAKNELLLAVARHATSKIQSADDLWKISSYGFRGEALASIAAVSRLQIISRPNNQEKAAQLIVNFGEITAVTDTGAEPGTTISIEELYANVPARLKFLKSEAGENTAIKTQLKALALANRQISFRVLQAGELLYYWPKTESLKARVEQVLEEAEMFSGEMTHDGFHADVVVSSPNRTVGQAKNIWCFVKGRFVQDRSLQAAVLDAYRSLLMHGEYPIAVLFVDCPAEEVDVNVSPTKSQVKFREASQAFRVVQRGVRAVLEKAPWLKNMLGETSGEIAPPVAKPYAPEEPQNMSFQSPEISYVRYPTKSLDLNIQNQMQPTAPIVAPVPTAVAHWSNLEVIGQAHLTYIITQKADAIIFVDQHAAHERVMFERLMKDFKENKVEVQNFLLPHSITVSEDGAVAIMKEAESFERMGLYIDQVGPTELAVRAAPSMIKSEAITPLIEKLDHELVDRGGSFQFEKTVSDLIATMACHSAIRAGQALSVAEMQALLQQMDQFALSSFCPHGRPVFVEYPIRKLERDFGRIV